MIVRDPSRADLLAERRAAILLTLRYCRIGRRWAATGTWLAVGLTGVSAYLTVIGLAVQGSLGVLAGALAVIGLRRLDDTIRQIQRDAHALLEGG